MNNQEQEARLDLIRRCVDDDATEQDFAELEKLLRDDSGFRNDYLLYLKVDSALAELPSMSQAVATSDSHSKTIPFPRWNPLISAAAGLLIGLFCASVAWAISTTREPGGRIVIPMIAESFESVATSVIEGFPTSAGVWGGDSAFVTSSNSGHQPAHGEAMLSLDSGADSNLGYLQQIIDVASLPHAGEGEMRTLDVMASFLADQPGEQERYTLRIASFKESPVSIHALWEGVAWRDMDKNTLTMTKSALSTSGDEDGWQTISGVLDVPVGARSVVISLAAGRLDVDAPKTPHYIDDIQANLVIAPLTKRKRRKIAGK